MFSRLRVATATGARALPRAPVWQASVLRVPPALRRPFTASPLLRCSAQAGSTAGGSAGGSAGAKSSRAIGYWLLGTAGSVFIMVVLGGVTRLTRSGLSIVEWKLAGEPLPTDDAGWLVEFEKYKLFPEYQRVNSRMTLDEFKFIYFMEWFHRFWGRAIGVGFTLPLVYFAATRSIPRSLMPRLGLLFGLGAMQGGVGWWMVKSGLEHERFNEYSVPRVSPYRLATHLGFAFTVYSLLVWTGLDVLHRAAPVTLEAAARTARLRPWALATTALVATTVASGAFVAGNDAGHAYNDWPFMAGRIIPEQFWFPELGLRNIFENTATVQFDHRNLAYATIAAVGGLHMAAKRAGGIRSLPKPVARNIHILSGLVAAQAALGITTLMMYVPVSLATCHQAGALALLTASVSLLHSMSAVKRAAAAGLNSATAAVADAATAAAATPAALRSKSVAGTAAAIAAILALGDGPKPDARDV